MNFQAWFIQLFTFLGFAPPTLAELQAEATTLIEPEDLAANERVIAVIEPDIAYIMLVAQWLQRWANTLRSLFKDQESISYKDLSPEQRCKWAVHDLNINEMFWAIARKQYLGDEHVSGLGVRSRPDGTIILTELNAAYERRKRMRQHPLGMLLEAMGGMPGMAGAAQEVADDLRMLEEEQKNKGKKVEEPKETVH